jgi:Sap, sulfolipid-1-addressing protein
MSTIESFGAGKAFGVGLFLGVLNPKNLPLTIVAAASIATSDLSNGSQAVVLVVYAGAATIGVGG